MTELGLREDETAASVEKLLAEEAPRFSPAEMQRRHEAIARLAAAVDVDLLVIHAANRFGSAVQWLTGWSVTREAILVIEPGQRPTMFVQFHNHVPMANEVAAGVDVRWGGPRTEDALREELERRGARSRSLGIIGQVPYRRYELLEQSSHRVVDLSSAYTDLRLVKSPEEIDWLRVGAHLSDLAVRALANALAVGRTEHELADAVERAYVPLGGRTHIHYLGVTSMRRPDLAAPRQYSTGRRLGPDDVVVAELSAAFGGYAGQVLRTMSLRPPTSLYEELHDVADAAFDAVTSVLRDGALPEEVVDAASVIEQSGYTIVDDLVHGFGGGYLPPVLGSASRPAGPLPDLPFRSGMTVVVQPNVTTPDRRAGVQTGELLLVTDDGVERLHTVATGPWWGA